MNPKNIDIPLEKIKDFCIRWQINELSLFGSVLRTDFRPDSDVDERPRVAERRKGTREC